MSPPLFVQLAQLENQLIRGKVLKPHYASLKWDILKLIYEKKEIVAPIYKDKRDRETLDGVGKCYCYVPLGPFIFGPDAEYGVTHSGFYIAKYPVTVKEFGQFIEETGYDYSEEDYEIMLEISPQQNCPVCNISWLDEKNIVAGFENLQINIIASPVNLNGNMLPAALMEGYIPGDIMK